MGTKARQEREREAVRRKILEAATQADHKDRAGYAQKGQAAVKAHGGVNAAVGGLNNAGYSVPGSLRSHFAHAVGLPTLKQDPVATPLPTAVRKSRGSKFAASSGAIRSGPSRLHAPSS